MTVESRLSLTNIYRETGGTQVSTKFATLGFTLYCAG